MSGIIIAGGFEINCVSKDFVDFVSFNTIKQSRAYGLGWLTKGDKVVFRHQCLVKFLIGNYEDEGLCDVVPMDACHILLGRPW